MRLLCKLWFVIAFGTFMASSRGATADDLVKQETRVADAFANYGVTGSGVIVGIMDRGIDWQNNDFRNVDGTTRIAYIFDLTDDTGATLSGNPYGIGTIYTRDQINNALLYGTTLPTRDAVGHGTSTAGICCGNGRNSPNGKYAGIAPNSTLIIVKVVSDGAPAHDGEAAEAPFFKSERISVAIDFIRDKATELGMPCVMLLNSGSTSGPADGTSSLSRKIDTTFGPGKPGLIFVTGTGDDGGMPNHAGGTVAAGESVSIRIQKGSALPLLFEMWYRDTDRFSISVDTPTASYGPYNAPANNSFDSQTTAEFQYTHNGSIYYTNQKRVVYVSLNGAAGNYSIRLFGAQIASGTFDAALNPSRFWDPNYMDNRFLSHVMPGKTIWDVSTAFNNIVPNSYVFRTSWVDIDGFTRSKLGEGVVGDLWRGSSIGPTWDGRLGMDISAPGENIITTYNPRSWWATFRYNLIQDGNGLYGMASAVSAANPLTVGIIALMLERNPTLDAVAVKSILQKTARQDSFTGGSPNPNWGYGKIDALAALNAVPPTIAGAAVAINNVSVSEGNSGTANAVFTLSLSPASSQSITVNFSTANGTAVAGFDLLAQSGALTFSPGETSKTITIEVIGDTVAESNETFFVNLTLVTNAVIAVNHGIGTILNDDAPATLANISTRGRVLTGDNVMIGGFIVEGASMRLLVRSRGPTMGTAPFNVSGTLANPFLRIFSGETVIAQNDNWQDGPTCSGFICEGAAAIIATNLDPCQPNPGQPEPPPNCNLESAILITLPAGAYTAIVSGADGGIGVGLVEVFEAEGTNISELSNISTRGFVQSGDNVMIGGLIIEGDVPATVLIRARGPSMSGAPFFVPGTLADPFLQVFSGQNVIAQNDNWQDAPSCNGFVCGTADQIAATGLDSCRPNPGQTTPPPSCTLESAILITLPPGAYTAIVSGVGGGTGVGLVEAFEMGSGER
jgi:hypothetical protein